MNNRIKNILEIFIDPSIQLIFQITNKALLRN